jgi:hypothetical protein
MKVFRVAGIRMQPFDWGNSLKSITGMPGRTTAGLFVVLKRWASVLDSNQKRILRRKVV